MYFCFSRSLAREQRGKMEAERIRAARRDAEGSTEKGDAMEQNEQVMTRQVCQRCGRPVERGEDHHCEDAVAKAA